MSNMKKYVVITYIVFWGMVLGLCGTASMVFDSGPVTMRILSNICAWSPTIVLLVGFKTFCPNKSVKQFYQDAFSGKVKILPIAISATLVIAATLIAVWITGQLNGKTFGTFWSMGGYPLWASFLFAVTTGPTGEESGWRGYVRPLLNEKYGFIKSCILQGIIWAFWHTVLWFVDSDFTGWQLIPYVISNVVVMTGLCFLMNVVMSKENNLLYAVWIHFCFNFLYSFLNVDIWFYVALTAIYILIIAGCILYRHYSISSEKRVDLHLAD